MSSSAIQSPNPTWICLQGKSGPPLLPFESTRYPSKQERETTNLASTKTTTCRAPGTNMSKAALAPASPSTALLAKLGALALLPFPLHSLSFPGAPDVYGEPRGNARQQLCWERRDTWRKVHYQVQVYGAEATQRQMGRASGGSSGGDKQRKEMESEWAVSFLFFLFHAP